jgi:hypothetical protein
MALSFAMARDAALPQPGPKWQVWWAIAVAVAATTVVTISGGLGTWETPSVATDVVLLFGIVGAVVVARPERIFSVGDYTDEPLDGRRVRYTRIVVAVAAAAGFLISGDEAIRALSPVWIAFAAGGVLRLIRRRHA